jgi:NAD(P)H-dependent FMN reductase
MKIFAIHGSPNVNGNSRQLVDRLLWVAQQQGARWEVINIYDYRVSDIWPDYFSDALHNDFSRADDNMAELKEKMHDADIILLATPVYCCQVSGRTKCFLDRWCDTLNPDFSSTLAGRGLALVTTHPECDTIHSSRRVQMAMEAAARFLGMVWLGGIDAPLQLSGSSRLTEGHLLLAEDFGAKLGRGENLIGHKIILGSQKDFSCWPRISGQSSEAVRV